MLVVGEAAGVAMPPFTRYCGVSTCASSERSSTVQVITTTSAWASASSGEGVGSMGAGWG